MLDNLTLDVFRLLLVCLRVFQLHLNSNNWQDIGFFLGYLF